MLAPHATAGLAIMETGAGSEGDLLGALERLLPRDDRYRHAHGSPGHGADHVLPAIVSPSVTLPVLGGRVAFGTWQSLVLVDLNEDNPRRHVRFSFLRPLRAEPGGSAQSKIGPRSRVRLSSKKPSVPVHRSTPSHRRPAASPLGAGVTTGPKMARPL